MLVLWLFSLSGFIIYIMIMVVLIVVMRTLAIIIVFVFIITITTINIDIITCVPTFLLTHLFNYSLAHVRTQSPTYFLT